MYVETAQMAVNILKQKYYGSPSDGITKLYAQMLAAKLNVANGADPEAVSENFEDADEFLADHDYDGWDSLSRKMKKTINKWKSTFDDYNNGDIGPGHCGD